MKRTLITGINGMDGSHLADLLLSKGYKVFGMERRSSSKNRTNTLHLEDKVTFLQGDLTDQNSLLRCLKESNPDEVYNLAAQSFVGESWNTPEHTSEVTALGVLRILEAIREFNPKIKFYQASSSEMFGRMVENPANENTPFYPRSPYGVSKLYGHWITKNYRESYDMFACSGILFNHESEKRGIEFVMLQQETPDDYVIATGNTYSIREFLDIAFNHVGIKNWEPYIKQDPRFMRPAEVDVLRGDFTKAKENLDWIPKTSFVNLVKKMVDNDINLLNNG